MAHVEAPNVLGLHPDDAARICYAADLEFVVENYDAMVWWGWDQPGARVVEQRLGPGNPLTSATVIARVGFAGRADAAGVREPQQPVPPGVPLAEADDDRGLDRP